MLCVSGRCDGLVIARWDKEEIGFSRQNFVCVSQGVLTDSWSVHVSIMQGYQTCSCAHFYVKNRSKAA